MVDLSILIPSRNEVFLKNTIENILLHMEGNTEIIAVLDGQWADPPIEDHPKVTLVYHSESIGQRAATNEAAKISTAKYVMKVDAHCAFDQGFDVKLMEDMQDNWTVVPVMRNLHAFDWVCPNGHRRYQGPSGPCNFYLLDENGKETGEICGEPTIMDIVWIAKPSPQSTAYRFDKTLHFQYWNEYKKKQEGDLVETLSLQGSCFMMTRERYLDLNICDEELGSWGNQGTEVACKSWLSGGRVLVNKKTWYAHMFRTQGKDFGFPYPLSGKQVEQARQKTRDLFLNNKWEKAIYPFSWLIEKFSPIPDWDNAKIEKEELTKEILYYTCNTHDEKIELACRKQLLKSNLPIISVSLNKEIDFGDTRIVMEGTRSPEMMHKQILEGLKNSKADIIFLCESDVLYHPSHFNFIPKRDDVFYYNTNVWKVRYPDGHAVWTDDLQQISGLCAYRELLIDYYTKKTDQINKKGFDRHYEPGTKNQTIYPHIRGGKYGSENHLSEFPNLCIRHDKTLTKSKWSPNEFRDPKYAKGWKETDEVPGWQRFDEVLKGLLNDDYR